MRIKWMQGIWLLAVLAFLLINSTARAAPKAKLWAYWLAEEPQSTATINHQPWEQFLGRYIQTDSPLGIHLVAYGQVQLADRQQLAAYLQSLQETKISEYRRQEQLAFWINLYNATTIWMVLEHWPVTSIRKIRPNLFSRGPWRHQWLQVEGKTISLHDIEHRILRPIWKDHRLHYVLNCASLGCPNLASRAYTSANTEKLMEAGATAFINHPRGVDVSKYPAQTKAIQLSSLYHWFAEDFGGRENLRAHLLRYAKGIRAQKLSDWSGDYEHHYDWKLNTIDAKNDVALTK